MNKSMLGYLWVIFGGLLVMTGGIVATGGWIVVSDARQKKNLVAALVREVHLNGKMIGDAQLLARRWPQRVEHEKFSYQAYRTAHTDAILGSGLFSFEDEGDRRLLEAVERYRSAAGAFNARLGIVGRLIPGLFIRPEFIPVRDKSLPEDDTELYSDIFLRLMNVHRELQALLRELYPHAVKRVWE